MDDKEIISHMFDIAGMRKGTLFAMAAFLSEEAHGVFMSECEMPGNIQERKIPNYYKVDTDIVYAEGTEDPQLPTKYAVAVAILDENDHVLFAERDPDLPFGGAYWSLPSAWVGSTEHDDIVRGISKVVYRSLGITIHEGQLTGRRMGLRVDKNGNRSRVLMHLVFATKYSGALAQTGYLNPDFHRPKYTAFGFFEPALYLRDVIKDKLGDCTKSFRTALGLPVEYQKPRIDPAFIDEAQNALKSIQGNKSVEKGRDSEAALDVLNYIRDLVELVPTDATVPFSIVHAVKMHLEEDDRYSRHVCREPMPSGVLLHVQGVT
jgi:hypothetical protein